MGKTIRKDKLPSKAPPMDKVKGKKPILMIKIGIGKPVKGKKGK